MAALNHLPDRFVALPFRKGEKDVPDWDLCSKYIASSHSSNHTTTVDDAIKSMSAYHNAMVKACQSDSKNAPTENFIERTLREYCRLVAMAQAHLPLYGGHVSKKLQFTWYDSFDDWQKYTSENANVELISSIYNLAASYVHVAMGQAQTGTVDGVKDAFKNYQNAAGYYAMVEQLSGRLPSEQLVKGDMKKESLQMLAKICTANAHHCGYLKAEEAMKGKHEVLSKVAKEAAKQYEEAHSMMKASTWYAKRSTAAKDVEITLDATRHIMDARANLHLAAKNEDDAEMGLAIAYYMKAKTCLTRLPKMPTQALTQWVNSIVSAVNKAHDAAEKANSSVYYSRIPKDIPEPEALGRALGQPTEHASFVNFTSKRGDDPFFGIIPAHIAGAAALWRDKQRSRVNACNSSAVSGRKTSTNKLQQLGVMAAIQTMSGEMQDRGRVPEPLRSTILKLRGGATGATKAVTQDLVSKVKACQEMQTVAGDKLQEIKKVLASEKETDMGYEKSYGERMWRAVCPRSEDMPDVQSLQAAYSAHKSSLQQYFVAPFEAARATLDANLRDIARLDWSMNDLDALMPFVQSKEARQQSSKVTELVEKLKKMMEGKEQLENEQIAEQSELMDILESDTVVFGLSAVESNQRDAILSKETQRISDAIERVNKKTREQENIVNAAESTMEELSTLQSADPVAQEIQKISNGLENACNVYTNLMKDFDDLAAYLSNQIDAIESTVNNAKSFEMSRKFNAEEVQHNLDSQIAQKMSEMRSAESQIEESRKRQQELQAQIAGLQGGQVQPTAPGYNYQQPPQPQMGGSGAAAPPYGYSQQQPPQPVFSSTHDVPPSYDAVMQGGGSQHPPAAPGYTANNMYNYPQQPNPYQYPGNNGQYQSGTGGAL